MDDLKALLEKRKKKTSQEEAGEKNKAVNTGGSAKPIFTKRAELEAKVREDYLQKEKQKKEEQEKKIQEKLSKAKKFYSASHDQGVHYLPKFILNEKQEKESVYSKILEAEVEEPVTPYKKEKFFWNSDREQMAPPMSKLELIKRLRSQGAPITLFGETDWGRYLRLCNLEGRDPEQFLKDSQRNLKGSIRLTEEELRKMNQTLKEFVFEEEKESKLLEERSEYFSEKHDEETKLMHRKPNVAKYFPFEEKCHDVLMWCYKMLTAWQRIIDSKSPEDAASLNGVQDKQNLAQCRKDINPLLYILMIKAVNDELLDSFFHIAHYCLMKEYVKAHDRYLELAIGVLQLPFLCHHPL